MFDERQDDSYLSFWIPDWDAGWKSESDTTRRVFYFLPDSSLKERDHLRPPPGGGPQISADLLLAEKRTRRIQIHVGCEEITQRHVRQRHVFVDALLVCSAVQPRIGTLGFVYTAGSDGVAPWNDSAPFSLMAYG